MTAIDCETRARGLREKERGGRERWLEDKQGRAKQNPSIQSLHAEIC